MAPASRSTTLFSLDSGLEQVLHLRPEVIKMDYFITHDIHRDSTRRAMAAGLTGIAADIGGRVVAEGIESVAELDAVVEAGIPLGQGYLLGAPSADILATPVAATGSPAAPRRPRGRRAVPSRHALMPASGPSPAIGDPGPPAAQRSSLSVDRHRSPMRARRPRRARAAQDSSKTAPDQPVARCSLKVSGGPQTG